MKMTILYECGTTKKPDKNIFPPCLHLQKTLSRAILSYPLFKEVSMKISSPAFHDGGFIPSTYTCDGRDISPELVWEDIPSQAKSLVLLCEDPDAPMGLFVHWVVFNIPPSTSGLPQGVSSAELTRLSAKQGRTDFGRIGYGGPCPPSATHRYFFKLYALDTLLSLPEGSTRIQVLKAMEGHILSSAELMGKYQRQR